MINAFIDVIDAFIIDYLC